MESFQILNLCHRINNWLLKAMEISYIGPTDISLNTTGRLCSQDVLSLLLINCIIAVLLEMKS